MSFTKEQLREQMLLYAVTDRHWLNGQTLYEQVEEALKGGATFIQLREKDLTEEEFLEEAKKIYPDALVLAHPECTADVLELADFIGSTSQIIDYATESTHDKFIVCTEMGIFYELGVKNPQKKFYSVGHRQFCPNMKKITIEKVRDVLENPEKEVILRDEIMESAKKPLEKMLELAAK